MIKDSDEESSRRASLSQTQQEAVGSRKRTGRLSLGAFERLMENLSVRPGAVTPLAMINVVKSGIQIYIMIQCRLIPPETLNTDVAL